MELIFDNISKKYGNFVAIDGVNFGLTKGNISVRVIADSIREEYRDNIVMPNLEDYYMYMFGTNWKGQYD